MSERVVIGVDSGGTRTRAVLARADGTVIGSGSAGSGNARDVGSAGLATSVNRAVSAAFDCAGLPPKAVAAAFLGVAGVATAREREDVLRVVRQLAWAPQDRIGVSHDLRIAQAGAFGGGPGMVLIVGTGSCCFGRAEDGVERRAGGWGCRLDDGGSAVDLGLRAIAAAVRESDGRGPRTVLTPGIIDALSLGTLRDVLDVVDGGEFPRRRVAALAPVVTRAAAEGDEVALSIIAKGAAELAVMVGAVRDGLVAAGPAGRPKLALVGGVLRAGPVVRDPVTSAILTRLRDCEFVEARMPAVLGAAMLACGLLDEIKPAHVERLATTGSGVLRGEAD